MVNTNGGVVHFTGIAWAGEAGSAGARHAGRPARGRVPVRRLPRRPARASGSAPAASPRRSSCTTRTSTSRCGCGSRAGGSASSPSAVVDHDYEFAKGAGQVAAARAQPLGDDRALLSRPAAARCSRPRCSPPSSRCWSSRRPAGGCRRSSAARREALRAAAAAAARAPRDPGHAHPRRVRRWLTPTSTRRSSGGGRVAALGAPGSASCAASCGPRCATHGAVVALGACCLDWRAVLVALRRGAAERRCRTPCVRRSPSPPRGSDAARVAHRAAQGADEQQRHGEDASASTPVRPRADPLGAEERGAVEHGGHQARERARLGALELEREVASGRLAVERTRCWRARRRRRRRRATRGGGRGWSGTRRRSGPRPRARRAPSAARPPPAYAGHERAAREHGSGPRRVAGVGGAHGHVEPRRRVALGGRARP